MDRSKSLQEVFSTVAVHLLRQNAQSMATPGSCFYRGPFGRMCAVGKLIKQEVYRSSLENHTIASFDVQHALFLSGVDTATPGMFELLRALQQLHDRYSADIWPAELANIAKHYNLSMPDTRTLVPGYIAKLIEPPKPIEPTQPVARLLTEVKEEELAL